METKYKGYTIKYEEYKNNEQFTVKIGDSSMSSEKLKNLKKRIDNFERKQNKFKRIDILCGEGWGSQTELKPGQITSVAGKSRYGDSIEVWTSVNGDRSKRDLSNLYLNTDKNQEIYKEIKLHLKDIKAIENKIRILWEQMEKPVLPEEE